MESKKFYNAADVAEILAVSKPTAYRIIKQLNNNLAAAGYLTIAGRIPVKFFNERFYS